MGLPRAAPPAGPAALTEPLSLEVALGRAVARWRGRSSPAWQGAGREEAARALVRTLVGLGTEAGVEAPPGAVPAAVQVHGLADQLAVVGAELAEALDARPDPGRHARALAAVLAAP